MSLLFIDSYWGVLPVWKQISLMDFLGSGIELKIIFDMVWQWIWKVTVNIFFFLENRSNRMVFFFLDYKQTSCRCKFKKVFGLYLWPATRGQRQKKKTKWKRISALKIGAISAEMRRIIFRKWKMGMAVSPVAAKNKRDERRMPWLWRV